MGCLVCWAMGFKLGWYADSLVCWLVYLVVGWLVCSLACWLVGWCVCCVGVVFWGACLVDACAVDLLAS